MWNTATRGVCAMETPPRPNHLWNLQQIFKLRVWSDTPRSVPFGSNTGIHCEFIELFFHFMIDRHYQNSTYRHYFHFGHLKTNSLDDEVLTREGAISGYFLSCRRLGHRQWYVQELWNGKKKDFHCVAILFNPSTHQVFYTHEMLSK